jgi:hypothetical protein
MQKQIQEAADYLSSLTGEDRSSSEAHHLRQLIAQATTGLTAVAAIGPAVAAIEAKRKAAADDAARVLAERAAMLAEQAAVEADKAEAARILVERARARAEARSSRTE